MDMQILLGLQNLREAAGDTFNTFFALITTIAVDYWVIIPALIIFWAVDKKNGRILMLSAGIGRLLTAVLKTAFCVYRPWIRDPAIKPLPEVLSGATGYSFPSGHAASSSSLYAALITVYRKHKGLCVFCAVMIILTMFSRMYVGVHTPQDVLAGAVIGFAAAITGWKTVEWTEGDPDKDRVILVIAVILMAATFTLIELRKYPMDYVDGKLFVDPKKMTVDGFKDPGTCFGMILGWFIEKRYINFSTEGTVYQKVLRCVTGAFAYIFMLTVIINPLGKAIGIGIVHFILQAMQPLLFMTVYPIIFTNVEKKL